MSEGCTHPFKFLKIQCFNETCISRSQEEKKSELVEGSKRENIQRSAIHHKPKKKQIKLNYVKSFANKRKNRSTGRDRLR